MDTATRPAERALFSRGFFVLLGTMFIGGCGMGTVAPLLPVIAKEMGATGIWLGLAFSAFAVTQTPLQSVFGRLSDRIGRRPFLAIGFGVYAVVGLCFMFAPSYQFLLALQLAVGIGTALVLPVAMAYVGENSPTGREGTVMGIFNLAFFTGWGLGPLVGGLLKDAGGNDAAFLAQSALTGGALAIVLMALPESSKRRSAGSGTGMAFSAMLRMRVVLALIAQQASLTFTAGVAFAFIGIYLTDHLAAAAALVGVVISTRVGLTGLLQIPGGRAADRMNRKLMIFVGMTAAGIATVAIPSMGSAGLVWLLFGFLGIADAISSPAGNAIAAETGRSVGMGQLMGVVTSAQSAGLLLGSLVGGAIESLAGIEQAFRVGGAVALLGMVITMLLLRSGSGRPLPAVLDSAQAGLLEVPSS